MKCLSPIVITKYRHSLVYYLPDFISTFLFKHFGIKGHLKSKVVFYAPCGMCAACRHARSVLHLNRIKMELF